VFHTFFDIKEIMQIPGERAGCTGGQHTNATTITERAFWESPMTKAG